MAKIKILVCEPKRAPYVKEIEDTLEEEQEIVGGLIDIIYPHDDGTMIVCNDEGKLGGYDINRALKDQNGDPYDVIFGTFFIVADGGETFASLSEDQIERYTRMYMDYLEEDYRDEHPEMCEPRMGFIPMNDLPWWEMEL